MCRDASGYKTEGDRVNVQQGGLTRFVEGRGSGGRWPQWEEHHFPQPDSFRGSLGSAASTRLQCEPKMPGAIVPMRQSQSTCRAPWGDSRKTVPTKVIRPAPAPIKPDRRIYRIRPSENIRRQAIGARRPVRLAGSIRGSVRSSLLLETGAPKRRGDRSEDHPYTPRATPRWTEYCDSWTVASAATVLSSIVQILGNE